ncbi:MAG: transposase, partial [Bacteroidota bacterium]|nr:transposase [Bacteroidota bacterium]
KLRRRMIIPKILGKLQMKTSKQINQVRKTPGQKNWQSDYYDHIIRDDASYHRIKNYIINNPKNWTGDKFNKKNNR